MHTMTVLGNWFLSFTNYIVMPFMLMFLLMATLGTMAGAKTDKLLSSAFELLELCLGGICRMIVNGLAALLARFIPHKSKDDKEKGDSSNKGHSGGRKSTRKPRAPKDGDGDEDEAKAETKSETKEQTLNNIPIVEYCSYCHTYKEVDIASRCSSCALPFFFRGK